MRTITSQLRALRMFSRFLAECRPERQHDPAVLDRPLLEAYLPWLRRQTGKANPWPPPRSSRRCHRCRCSCPPGNATNGSRRCPTRPASTPRTSHISAPVRQG